ncbi:hypothetical protein D3C73_1574590 [compost metagenome]
MSSPDHFNCTFRLSFTYSAVRLVTFFGGSFRSETPSGFAKEVTFILAMALLITSLNIPAGRGPLAGST